MRGEGDSQDKVSGAAMKPYYNAVVVASVAEDGGRWEG